MKIPYEETVKFPMEFEEQDDALKALNYLREKYPAYEGWVELEGYAKQLKNGKWVAVRKQKRL